MEDRERGGPRARHDLAARVAGAAAIAVGVAYLAWRVTHTLAGAAPLLAIPLLLVELWSIAVLALHVVELWTRPRPRADDPADDDGWRYRPVVDVVVDAAGASLDALSRTLVGCDVLDGAREVVVVDDRDRVPVREIAARHRARVVVHDAPSAVARVAAARASDADAICWLDAGQMPVPDLIADVTPVLAAPDVAAVQVSVGRYNSDSLVHLSAGRDESTFRDEVVAPALDRWGCAPWLGGGSLVRVAALDALAPLTAPAAPAAPAPAGGPGGALPASLSPPRAALRWHQLGWTTRSVDRVLVRASAPDAIETYLADHRRRAERSLAVLLSRDNPLIAPRLGVRQRVAHLAGALRYLSGLARLTVVAVLVAALLTGRLPIVADPVALALWWTAVWGATTLAWHALARGTVRVGDRTRQSWRTMGAHCQALVRVLTGRSRTDDVTRPRRPRRGLAVLGDLPLLTASNAVLQLALVTRAATMPWPHLLPAFTPSARLFVLGASLATSAQIAAVLQILVRRRQRRETHRLTVDLPVTIDGEPAHAVDLTPSGVGVLIVPPLAYHDGQAVTIGLVLRRRDMSIEELVIAGTVRHGRNIDGATRLGVELAPDEFAHDRLVEYCGITYYESTPDAFSPAFVSDELTLEDSRARRVALRTSLLFAFGFGLVTLAFGPATHASAAVTTITWSGAGATTNWTDTGNWVGGVAPTSSQVAVFDTNTKNVTINAGINVAGVQVTSSYTGTITQSGANAMTIGASGWTQDGGTFTPGSGNISVSGAFNLTNGSFGATTGTTTFSGAFAQSGGTFTASSGAVTMNSTFSLSGGTFTAPNTGNQGTTTLTLKSTVTISGGTYNANNGIVSLAGSFTWNGSLSVYKLTHTSGNVAIAGGATITASNNVTLTAGSLTSGTIAALGDVYTTSTYSGGAGTLLFNGSGAQSINGGATSSAGNLPLVVINKASGTLTLNGSIRTGNSWTLTSGTLAAGTSTFYAAGTFTITGTQTFNAFTETTGALSIDPSSTVTVSGLLTLTGGSIASGTLDAQAGVTEAAAYTGGAGTLRMSGAANQSMGGTATTSSGSLPNFVVNKSGGSLTISGTVRTSNSWTLTAGTVSNLGTVALGGNLTITGNQTFSGLYLQSGNITIDAASTVAVSSSLNFAGGSLLGGTLHATGDLIEQSTYSGGAGTVQIDGTGAQALTGGATTASGGLPVVVVNKSAGTLSLSGTVRTGNSWTLTAGTVDPGTSTFVTAGTFTITGTETFYAMNLYSGTLSIANGSTVTASNTVTLTAGSLASGTLHAAGNVVETTGYTGGAGTLQIDGTGAQSLSGTATTTAGAFPVVVINKASGTLTMSGTLRITTTWTATAGTIDPSTSTVVVAGGTLTISGTQPFNALNLYSGTITIGNASTVTASGAVTLTGGSLAGGTLHVAGDLAQTAAYVGGAGTLQIDGTGAQAFSGTATTSSGFLPYVVINKASGTLTLSGTLRAYLNWTVTAGTIDPSTSTLVITGNVTITGTQPLNNLYLYSGYFTVANGSTVTVTGTLTMAGGYFLGGTLHATGDIVDAAANGGGVGTLQIDGTGAQTLTGQASTSAGAMPPVVINKPSGTLSLTGTIRTASAWTLTQGTMDAGSSTLAFSATATITGTQTFFNLYHASGTLTPTGGTVTVAGTLTLSGGSLGVGTLDATGAVIEQSTYSGGESGTLRFSGSADQTFTGQATTSAGNVPQVVVNKSGGTLTLAGTIRTTHSWTLTAGTVDPGTSLLVLGGGQTITGNETFNDVNLNGGTSTLTIAVNSTISARGTLTLTGGSLAGTLHATGDVVETSTYLGGSGTLQIDGTGAQTFSGTATTSAGALPLVVVNKSAGTLTLSGTLRTSNSWTVSAGTIDSGTSTFVPAANLTITAMPSFYNLYQYGGWTTYVGASTVNGTLTLQNGKIQAGTVHATGDIVASSNYAGGSGTLQIDGSGPQTLTGQASSSLGALPVVVINKPSGTLTLSGTLRTSSDWTWTAGTVDPGTSIVYLAGTDTITAGGMSFSDVQLISTGAPAQIVTLGADLRVAHDLVVGSLTTLTTGGHDVHVGHAFTVNGSVVGSSNLLFDGTLAASLAGTNVPHFNGVTIADPAGVDLGANLAVDGTLTFSQGDLRVAASTVTLVNPIVGTRTHLVTTSASTVVVGGSGAGMAIPAMEVGTLSVTNANGATADGALTVDTQLSLSGGPLVASAGVTVPSGGSIATGSSAWVAGPLGRYVSAGVATTSLYPIGDPSASEPVTLATHNVSTGGIVTISQTTGLHPQIASAVLDPARSVLRYWTVDLGATQLASYDASVNFLLSDRANNVAPALLLAKRYAGGGWHDESATTGSKTATFSGVTAGGDLVLGASGAADLGVTVSAPPTADAGHAVGASVTVANSGPAGATGVVATITVPAGATAVTGTPDSGSCSTSGATVTCALGALASGGSVSVAVSFTPAVGASSSVLVSADGDQVDGNAANDSASAPIVVRGKADVGVAVNVPANVDIDVPMSGTVNVTNHGPETATGVVATIAVPVSATDVSATPASGSCALTGSVLTCSVGSLASGASVAIAVGVTPTVSGTATVSAGVAADQIDETSANDTAAASSIVRGRADVGVTLSLPATADADTEVDGALTLTNHGPETATGVVATIGVPATAIALTAAPGSGSCSIVAATIRCPLVTVANGASVEVGFTFTPTVGGAANVTATAAADQIDVDRTNDAASGAVVVRGKADVGIAVAIPANVDIDAADAGTVTVTNHGPETATGVVATIAVPASASGVSATPDSGSCSVTGATITCALGSLANGSSVGVALAFTPTVAGSASATASAAADQIDVNAANDSGSASTAVRGRADAGISVSLPASIDVDAAATAVVTVTNHGPETATGIVATIAVPASASGVSAAPDSGSCSVTGATISCALGSLANGSSVGVSVHLTPAVAGAASVSATVAADQIDGNGANDSASAATTVRGKADVGVAVSLPANADVDTVVHGTVTVTNDGPETATGVAATIVVPASAGGPSATPGAGSCVPTGATFTCTVGSLAAGGHVAIAVAFTPTAAGAAGVVAGAGADQIDVNGANDSASAATTVRGKADLGIAVSLPANADVDTVVNGTVTVTDDGPETATGVVVTIVVPASASGVSATPDAGSCSTSGASITCSIGTVTDGSPVAIAVHFTPSVGGAASVGATVAGHEIDVNAANDASAAATTVRGKADVGAAVVLPAHVDVDAVVNGTVSITNQGPETATNVTATIVVPATATSIAATPDAGSCALAGHVFTCALGTVTSGGHVAIAVVLTPTLGGTPSVTASVAADQVDPNAANDSASASVAVRGKADVSADVSLPAAADVDTAVAGTVTVTNHGPETGTNVVATIVVPSSSTSIAATPDSGSCVLAGHAFTCALGSIDDGMSVSIAVGFTPTVGGLATVSATVVADQIDLDAGNVGSASVAVRGKADVGVAVALPANGDAGSSVAGTVTTTNHGPERATGVVATIAVPASATAVSATPDSGSCSVAGATITCALGSLTNGATVAVAVDFTPASGGTAQMTAAVTADQIDGDATNDAASAATTVRGAADMGVTLDVPAHDHVGTALEATATLTNHGPEAATGATVTITVPASAGAVSAAPETGSCAVAAATITCTVGSVASGDSRSVAFGFTPSVSGTAHVDANAAADQLDHDPSDDAAHASVTVPPLTADVGVAITAPAQAGIHHDVEADVTVRSQGPDPANGVVATIDVPAGATAVSATPATGSCSLAVRTLTCSLGQLASGDAVVVAVHYTPTVVGTAALAARATADEYDPVAADGTATADVDVRDVADVRVELTVPPTTTQDGRLRAQVVVTNNGPQTAAATVLTITLPGAVTDATWTTTTGSCALGAVLTCDLGDLAPGATPTIVVTVTATTAGDARFDVAVSSHDVDFATADNFGSAVVSIGASPPPATTTTAPGSAEPGTTTPPTTPASTSSSAPVGPTSAPTSPPPAAAGTTTTVRPTTTTAHPSTTAEATGSTVNRRGPHRVASGARPRAGAGGGTGRTALAVLVALGGLLAAAGAWWIGTKRRRRCAAAGPTR